MVNDAIVSLKYHRWNAQNENQSSVFLYCNSKDREKTIPERLNECFKDEAFTMFFIKHYANS